MAKGHSQRQQGFLIGSRGRQDRSPCASVRLAAPSSLGEGEND